MENRRISPESALITLKVIDIIAFINIKQYIVKQCICLISVELYLLQFLCYDKIKCSDNNVIIISFLFPEILFLLQCNICFSLT